MAMWPNLTQVLCDVCFSRRKEERNSVTILKVKDLSKLVSDSFRAFESIISFHGTPNLWDRNALLIIDSFVVRLYGTDYRLWLVFHFYSYYFWLIYEIPIDMTSLISTIWLINPTPQLYYLDEASTSQLPSSSTLCGETVFFFFCLFETIKLY